MTRKSYDMINEVIANFDFEKVRETMCALDWTWADEGIPCIKSLKDSAYDRLSCAIKQVLDPNNKEHHSTGWISSSGGLKATAWKNEDGTLAKILLEFVVTEWDADDEEYD